MRTPNHSGLTNVLINSEARTQLYLVKFREFSRVSSSNVYLLGDTSSASPLRLESVDGQKKDDAAKFSQASRQVTDQRFPTRAVIQGIASSPP